MRGSGPTGSGRIVERWIPRTGQEGGFFRGQLVGDSRRSCCGGAGSRLSGLCGGKTKKAMGEKGQGPSARVRRKIAEVGHHAARQSQCTPARSKPTIAWPKSGRRSDRGDRGTSTPLAPKYRGQPDDQRRLLRPGKPESTERCVRPVPRAAKLDGAPIRSVVIQAVVDSHEPEQR